MNKKFGFYTTGLLLLAAFSGYAFVQFNDALTPYVSYEKAIVAERNVQVAGGLQKGSTSYDESVGNLHFTLVDTEDAGKTLPVRYNGVKPANFEEAISIVAIGAWDAEHEEFAAHDLLVKCPSKYQGVEDYETKSYSAGDSQPAAAGEGYGSEGYGEKSYGSESYGEKSYGSEGYGEKSYGADGYSQPSAGDVVAPGAKPAAPMPVPMATTGGAEG
ncbi:MAG: cytochrome c maturation protein CcmE [Acidobacteriota bacterium]